MNNPKNEKELIQKILTRKQLETESLIEAAKQNPNGSKEELVKMGKEIFQKKYSESVVKDEKEGQVEQKEEQKEVKKFELLERNVPQIDVTDEKVLGSEAEEEEQEVKVPTNYNLGIIAKMVNGIKKYMQIQEFYESNKNQLSEKREDKENNKRSKKAGFVDKIKTVINPIKFSGTVENEEKEIEKDRDK